MVLSEAQNIVANQARRYADDQFSVDDLRRRRSDTLGRPMRETWKDLSKIGYTGATLAEEYGGSGLGFLELGCVLEAFGRRLATTPLIPTLAISGTLLSRGSPDARRKDILTAMATGEAIVAPAFEERTHFDPCYVETCASISRDGYRLNGRKRIVLDGDEADWIIVSALVEGELMLFVVSTNAPGVTCTHDILIDSRVASVFEFDDVILTTADFVASGRTAKSALDDALAIGAICVSAEMLGVAEAAFHMTTAHLKERIQFGVKIGSFQALQHRAARWFTEIELLRSVVYKSLAAIDAGTEDIDRLASACKARASDTVIRSGEEGIQLHGGIGMTDDHDIGFYLKRARVLQQWLGDATWHRQRYADLAGY